MMTIAEIQQVVAQRYRISVLELVCHRREQRICLPRHVAMYLARELTPASLPVIGRHFGHRDHTTIMSACQRIERLLEQDPELASQMSEIIGQLQPEEIAA
jgi:chromosomal replication initiator protein